MKSIIHELYYGSLGPITQIKPYRDEDKRICDNFDSFIESIGVEKAKEFDEFMTHQLEVQAFQLEEAFSEGFKLGVQLTSEALLKNTSEEN